MMAPLALLALVGYSKLAYGQSNPLIGRWTRGKTTDSDCLRISWIEFTAANSTIDIGGKEKTAPTSYRRMNYGQQGTLYGAIATTPNGYQVMLFEVEPNGIRMVIPIECNFVKTLATGSAVQSQEKVAPIPGAVAKQAGQISQGSPQVTAAKQKYEAALVV